MNLINGTISYDDVDINAIELIKNSIHATLRNESLNVHKVIEACDQLAAQISLKEYEHVFEKFGISNNVAELYFNQFLSMFIRNL